MCSNKYMEPYSDADKPEVRAVLFGETEPGDSRVVGGPCVPESARAAGMMAEVRIILAQGVIAQDELDSAKVNQIVILGNSIHHPSTVVVGMEQLFAGRPGLVGTRKSLCIEQRLSGTLRRHLGSVDVAMYLGSTWIPTDTLCHLQETDVILLDQVETDPITLLANGHLFANGKVVAVDGVFGFRISEFV